MTTTSRKVTPTPTYQALITEQDISFAIRATRLYWVTRFGRQVQRSWAEMTLSERSGQIQAEQRAAEVVLNDPSYAGGY